MIGLGRDFVEIMPLVLLIGTSAIIACSGHQSTWTKGSGVNSNTNTNNNNDFRESLVELGTGSGDANRQLVQYETNNVIQDNRDNLKRFLLKDLDLDGYMQKKPTREQWRLFQLKELLDTISSSIPTPAPTSSPLQFQPIISQQQLTSPLYRTGRGSYHLNYLDDYTSGDVAGGNIFPPAAAATDELPATVAAASSFAKLGRQFGEDSNIKSSSFTTKKFSGLDYSGKRPTGSSAVLAVRRSQLASGPTMELGGAGRSQHQTGFGNEEVAMAPMHSRSMGDNEWKRVENLSKWNNLRGMWGKRAAPTLDGPTES